MLSKLLSRTYAAGVFLLFCGSGGGGEVGVEGYVVWTGIDRARVGSPGRERLEGPGASWGRDKLWRVRSGLSALIYGFVVLVPPPSGHC